MNEKARNAITLLSMWEEHDIMEREILNMMRLFTDDELKRLQNGEEPLQLFPDPAPQQQQAGEARFVFQFQRL